MWRSIDSTAESRKYSGTETESKTQALTASWQDGEEATRSAAPQETIRRALHKFKPREGFSALLARLERAEYSETCCCNIYTHDLLFCLKNCEMFITDDKTTSSNVLKTQRYKDVKSILSQDRMKTVEVSTTAAVSATVYTTWDTWDTWDGDITMSRHHTSTETDVREPEVGTKSKSKDNISKNDSGKSESQSYELNSSKNLIWKVQVKINQVKILWYDQTLQNSY